MAVVAEVKISFSVKAGLYYNTAHETEAESHEDQLLIRINMSELVNTV